MTKDEPQATIRLRKRVSQPPYVLEAQIGFLLRQVSQRHSSIFVSQMGDELTPTQWAVLAKLQQIGAVSQNQLGRLTAMDGATINGVVSRLVRRGLVSTVPDSEDGRRLVVSLAAAGRDLVEALTPVAFRISDETVAPLAPAERETLYGLLKRLL